MRSVTLRNRSKNIRIHLSGILCSLSSVVFQFIWKFLRRIGSISASSCDRSVHTRLQIRRPLVHSSPGVGIAALSAQTRYAAGTREILECFFENRPIRDEYLIVDGGKLAGAGAHSYTVKK